MGVVQEGVVITIAPGKAYTGTAPTLRSKEHSYAHINVWKGF